MAQLVNQYSFLFLAVPLVLFLLYLLLRPPGSRLKQVLAIALLAGTVAVFVLAQTGRGTASGQQALDILQEAGRPTLLELYSNY